MKFAELPHEAQIMAAQTLSDRFPAAGSPKVMGSNQQWRWLGMLKRHLLNFILQMMMRSVAINLSWVKIIRLY